MVRPGRTHLLNHHRTSHRSLPGSSLEVVATIGKPNELLAPLQAAGLVKMNNTTGAYQWYPEISANHTANVSIQKDLKPIVIKQYQLIISDPRMPGYRWLQSYFAINDTIDVISGVSASILLLNGENDTQVPVENPMLLEQKLIEVIHPDHQLITYPGLGHTFYPSSNWIQPLGPIRENVLADMHEWLTNPARKMRYLS